MKSQKWWTKGRTRGEEEDCSASSAMGWGCSSGNQHKVATYHSGFVSLFFLHELCPDHVPKVSELCLIIQKKGKNTHAAMSRTCPTRAWQANCHVCALQYVYPIYMRYSSEIKFITYKKKFRSIATYVF